MEAKVASIVVVLAICARLHKVWRKRTADHPKGKLSFLEAKAKRRLLCQQGKFDEAFAQQGEGQAELAQEDDGRGELADKVHVVGKRLAA